MEIISMNSAINQCREAILIEHVKTSKELADLFEKDQLVKDGYIIRKKLSMINKMNVTIGLLNELLREGLE